MKVEWINIKDKMPSSGKRVLIVYKNSLGKNRIVIGHHTEKFTDENYDMDGEFFEYDEKNDMYYVPKGWYESSYSHEEYYGYWLENQDVLFWAEVPESPLSIRDK